MVQPKLEDTSGLLVAIAMFQGIYKRVADKVGVDASFVSRVVNGKRQSPAVMAVMRCELRLIRDYLNHPSGKSNGR